jgi:hypothetical protein
VRSLHTCAARARRASPLLLLALLIALLPQSGPVSGAFGAATPAPLSLGFSPSSLYPVADGTPVYTVGDTIWAQSGYNYSVPLSVISADAHVVATTLVGPDAVTALYSFTSRDTDGVWNLTLATLQGQVVIPFHFVNLAAHPVSLGPFAYSLDRGDLQISTTASLGDSYDQEVCAAGNATGAGVTLGLPTAMGETGNLTLTPGTPFGVAATGQVNEPFSFWFELYHSYSLDVVNTNDLVTDNLTAADSQPVAFSTNGTATTTLAWNLPVHAGRYQIRAYFENSTSLEVVQRSILILNDSSWVPLTNACPPQAVKSSEISYSANLTDGVSNWPSAFYVMYQTFGVEAVSSYSVRANVSSVNFTFPPWDLTPLSVNVSVSPSAGVLQTSQGGSSLFVLASRYPAQVDYTLDVNGESDLAQGAATILRSYSSLTESVSLALLTVHVLSSRNLATILDVAGPAGLNVSSTHVGVNQSATFLLPTGAYTVTGLQANSSRSARVSVEDGLADSLTLTFSTVSTPSAGGSNEALAIVLIGAAAVGAIANAAFWLLRSRSLGARMASAEPKGSQRSLVPGARAREA